MGFSSIFAMPVALYSNKLATSKSLAKSPY